MSSSSISSIPNIAIIGPGRVGSTLAMAMVNAGLPLVAIGGRDQAKSKSAAPSLEACTPSVAASIAKIVFLTVSDSAIAPVCDQLVREGALSPGTILVHVSGALSSEILQSAKETAHCKIASAHPLQTFASPETALETLAGAHWFLEGDSEAVDQLSKLIVVIGGKANSLPTDKKPLYHAASVLASNYLTALLDAALEIMEEAGIDREHALPALERLSKSALNNTFALGPEKALTGPIARADFDTVKHHLVQLSQSGGNVSVDSLYRSIGRQTIKLALRQGSIDNKQAQEMLELLNSSVVSA
jgi:predicted short-subunit dehydrogenase-like oxidoreductase (DUF2520 family)